MRKNDYVIYNLNLATELIHQGFKLIRTAPNRKFPNFVVFYFEDSHELRLAIANLK